MRPLVFLGLAYALAWAGIVAYLLVLSRRTRDLERRVRALSEERGEAPKGPEPGPPREG